MMGHFTLWAQALDNSSPDHFKVGGNELAEGDTIRRQEAVSLVSRVIENGTRYYDFDGVLLTADAKHFVVEAPSVQRDQAGRTAPIICCGLYEFEDNDKVGYLVAAALSDFAISIGRTLLSEHLEHTQASFTVLKKKRSKPKRAFKIGVLVLMVLFAAFWLAQRS